MKRVLAATALIGFALLASGCSTPTAYTINNHTESDLIVVATRTSCEQPPSRQDDYVHEAVVKRGRVEIYRAGWAYDDEVQCLRVLRPDREIVLEKRYDASGGSYGPSGRWVYPNTYTISDATPISDAPMPKESDFPGPPLSQRIENSAKAVGLILLIIVLIGLGIGVYTFLLTLFYGLPIYLAYLLVKAIVSSFKKPKSPPLN
jgi:hypothetical protein